MLHSLIPQKKTKKSNIGHTYVVVFVRLLHVLQDPYLKTAGNIAKSAGVSIFTGNFSLISWLATATTNLPPTAVMLDNVVNG